MRGATRAVLLAAALLTTTNPTAPAGAEVPACRGQTATIVGTAGDDTLAGTPDADVVVGLGGDDVLTGEAGDDLLCGGRGDDVLTGAGGADRLLGGRGGDEIHDIVMGSPDQELLGGPGDDVLTFAWRVREDDEDVAVTFLTDLTAGVAVPGDTGLSFPLRSFRTVRAQFSEGRWAVVGTDGDDRFITHQYLAVDARTGLGRDLVRGSWHDDRIRGGPGRDTAYADRGRDACRSVERGPLGECETLI